MTRFAIDAVVAIRFLREGRVVPGHHQLVAPAGLRSEVLARLYRDVRVGVLTDRDGRQLLDALAGLKIRLLADRVSRSTAWKIATDLDWDDVGLAEYLAVAKLQADALVTEDPRLANQTLVPVAAFDDLLR